MRRTYLFIAILTILLIQTTVEYGVVYGGEPSPPYYLDKKTLDTFEYWFEYTFYEIYPNVNNPYVDRWPPYPGQTYYIFDNITLYLRRLSTGNHSDFFLIRYWHVNTSTLLWQERVDQDLYNITFQVGNWTVGNGTYKLEIIHRSVYEVVRMVNGSENRSQIVNVEETEEYFKVVDYNVQLENIYIIPFYKEAKYDRDRYASARNIDVYGLAITPKYDGNLSQLGYRLAFRNYNALLIGLNEEIESLKVRDIANNESVNETLYIFNITMYKSAAIPLTYLEYFRTVEGWSKYEGFMFAPLNIEIRNHSITDYYPPPAVKQAFNLTDIGDFPYPYPSQRTWYDTDKNPSSYIITASGDNPLNASNTSIFKPGYPIQVTIPDMPVIQRDRLTLRTYDRAHRPEMPIPGEALLLWIYFNTSEVMEILNETNVTYVYLYVSMDVYNGVDWEEVIRVYPMPQFNLYSYIRVVETRWNGTGYEYIELDIAESNFNIGYEVLNITQGYNWINVFINGSFANLTFYVGNITTSTTSPIMTLLGNVMYREYFFYNQSWPYLGLGLFSMPYEFLNLTYYGRIPDYIPVIQYLVNTTLTLSGRSYGPGLVNIMSNRTLYYNTQPGGILFWHAVYDGSYKTFKIYFEVPPEEGGVKWIVFTLPDGSVLANITFENRLFDGLLGYYGVYYFVLKYPDDAVKNMVVDGTIPVTATWINSFGYTAEKTIYLEYIPPPTLMDTLLWILLWLYIGIIIVAAVKWFWRKLGLG